MLHFPLWKGMKHGGTVPNQLGFNLPQYWIPRGTSSITALLSNCLPAGELNFWATIPTRASCLSLQMLFNRRWCLIIEPDSEHQTMCIDTINKDLACCSSQKKTSLNHCPYDVRSKGGKWAAGSGMKELLWRFNKSFWWGQRSSHE